MPSRSAASLICTHIHGLETAASTWFSPNLSEPSSRMPNFFYCQYSSSSSFFLPMYSSRVARIFEVAEVRLNAWLLVAGMSTFSPPTPGVRSTGAVSGVSLAPQPYLLDTTIRFSYSDPIQAFLGNFYFWLSHEGMEDTQRHPSFTFLVSGFYLDETCFIYSLLLLGQYYSQITESLDDPVCSYHCIVVLDDMCHDESYLWLWNKNLVGRETCSIIYFISRTQHIEWVIRYASSDEIAALNLLKTHYSQS